MKLKALLLAIAVTLVVASGAAAKNGGGNGNGQGHAQTGNSEHAQNQHFSQGSKHEAKGHKSEGHKTKVKKPKKHDAAEAEETGDEPAPIEAADSDQPTVEAKNPAWTCRSFLEERGAEKFVSDFGTNANGANAFGKCVSSVAQGDDEASAEVPAEPTDQCEAVAPAPVEPTEVEATHETQTSDDPEEPACEPADEAGAAAPPAEGDASSTGDTTGTETVPVSVPAVPSSDDALLAAVRAVRAFAASL